MRQTKVKDKFLNELNVEIYDNIKAPKGVVLIVHGLNEHARRYVEFCEYLNKESYIAIAYDQFSQGYSRKDDEEYVNFTKNGVHILLNGLDTIVKYIQTQYPNVPLFGFGHSMGTMVMRMYLQTHENPYQKIILNGGGYTDPSKIWMALLPGKFIQMVRGNKPTQFFDNIFRQTQTKIIEKVEIDHFIEWLTSDAEKTAENMKDPFLFIRLTTNSYLVNLKMIQYINQFKHMELTSLDCEVLLLSGSYDPATDFGRGVKELNDLYKELGINSKCIIYDEGRHDTLQERNRLEVFNDIKTFLGGQ